MRRIGRTAGTTLALAPAFALATACSPSFSGDQNPPAGYRTISGKLTRPDPSVLSKNNIGLELVAAHIDTQKDPPVHLYPGPAFDPSGTNDQIATFRAAAPIDQTVVLVFQLPGSGAMGFGKLVARVVFPKARGSSAVTDIVGGTRGSSAPNLDLGTVTIARVGTGDSAERIVTLGVDANSKNPLATNDVNGDGKPDLDDPDLDGDLIPNDVDTDADGDGIPDVYESFQSLRSLKPDGTPAHDPWDDVP